MKRIYIIAIITTVIIVAVKLLLLPTLSWLIVAIPLAAAILAQIWVTSVFLFSNIRECLWFKGMWKEMKNLQEQQDKIDALYPQKKKDKVAVSNTKEQSNKKEHEEQ